MKNNNDLIFWLKEKVKIQVPVEQVRKLGKPAHWGWQIGCVIVTCFTGIGLTYLYAENGEETGAGISASALGGGIITAITCCLLPATLKLFTKSPTINQADLEVQIKIALQDTLKNSGYDLTDEEFKKYFKIAEKNLSNEEILKDFESLINQDALKNLVEKISQQIIEETATETTSLIGSVQNV